MLARPTRHFITCITPIGFINTPRLRHTRPTGLLPILLARTRQHSRGHHHGRDEWVSGNTGKMARSRLAAPAKGCAAMAAD